MSFLPVQAIVNLRMLFVLMGVCCILIGVNCGWDEEVGLLKRGGGGSQREFDYFKLCVQWPGTYCRRTRHCCSNNACCSRSKSPSIFTIHGLWAEYNDGTWPSCCSNRPFDQKEFVTGTSMSSDDTNKSTGSSQKLSFLFVQISTLLEPLNKYWPSLSCGSPRSCSHRRGPFWGHEILIAFLYADSGDTQLQWEKHGTCAYPVVHDEYEFFLTTLNVYFKYNVTKVLFNAGYVPSNSEKYPLGGIITAIENAFHTTPELICSGDALEELRFCFYKNFEPRACAHDTSLRGSCPQYVSLPAHHGGLEAIQQQLLSLQESLVSSAILD